MFKQLVEKRVYAIVSNMVGIDNFNFMVLRVTGCVISAGDDMIILRIEKFEGAPYDTKFAIGKNVYIPVSKIISIIEL